MATTPIGAARLAARLRLLREQEFGTTLTQTKLAEALSGEGKTVKATTLSAWESTTNLQVPTPSRLNAYARFFATPRSLDGERPHLFKQSELQPDEVARFHALEAEFNTLLESEDVQESDARRTPLEFSGRDNEPVVIICPELPEKQRGPMADRTGPNFTELHQYADIDALLEVFGHIRALNPRRHVLRRLPSTLNQGEIQNHLVVLGGIGWNQTTRQILATIQTLPVEQIFDDGVPTGEIFRIKKEVDATQPIYGPTMDRPDDGGKEILVEDVALIARLPNPFNINRTLTFLNGVHSRGVVGAALALTDERVRPTNEQYLAERFPQGDFAMLVKVPVLGGFVVAPDLQNPQVRIFEWSPQEREG